MPPTLVFDHPTPPRWPGRNGPGRARLEQLLDRLGDADVPPAEHGDSDLESATAEDGFALIDDESGS
ncbi:hypothetical protein ACIQI7_03070 [Kitasatospora sp. NPDC092039]|uniref:hypothetical protein n=1 Tax=Kitasatospora sp. NPDC092039 TaxID=3364086 RepID=UPI00381FF791